MSALDDAHAALRDPLDFPRTRAALQALVAEHEATVRELHQRELHHFETEKLLTTGFVLNATVTRGHGDDEVVMPRFTGPFATREEAEAFVVDQVDNDNPIHGYWTIRELTPPEDWPDP